MHIIAGERRGAQLLAPAGMDTRPTQAKVKESLFSIIQWYVPDAHVLDLFAGSGSLALEALSRGAESAVLADANREAAGCIQKNIVKLRYEQKATLFRGDWQQAVSRLQEQGKGFDLVFLDPPYRMEIMEECCQRLARAGLLNRDCMLVLEHRTGAPAEPGEGFSLLKERTYGDTQIHFYLYGQEAEP